MVVGGMVLEILGLVQLESRRLTTIVWETQMCSTEVWAAL